MRRDRSPPIQTHEEDMQNAWRAGWVRCRCRKDGHQCPARTILPARTCNACVVTPHQPHGWPARYSGGTQMAIAPAVTHVANKVANLSKDIAVAMMADRTEREQIIRANPTQNFTLWGPPGTGKSSFARTIAQETGREAYPVQSSDQMSGASFFQMAWVELSGAMSARRGPGLEAFESGGVLVVEDAHNMSLDGFGVLYMLLVDGIGANVRTLDNTLVAKHPNSVAYLTMNGHPSELPEAILDRAVPVQFPCPSEAMVRTLAPDLARLTTRAYAAAYSEGLADGLPITFRQMQQYGRLRRQPVDRTVASMIFMDDKEMVSLFCDHLLPLVIAPSGTRQS